MVGERSPRTTPRVHSRFLLELAAMVVARRRLWSGARSLHFTLYDQRTMVTIAAEQKKRSSTYVRTRVIARSRAGSRWPPAVVWSPQALCLITRSDEQAVNDVRQPSNVTQICVVGTLGCAFRLDGSAKKVSDSQESLLEERAEISKVALWLTRGSRRRR